MFLKDIATGSLLVVLIDIPVSTTTVNLRYSTHKICHGLTATPFSPINSLQNIKLSTHQQSWILSQYFKVIIKQKLTYNKYGMKFHQWKIITRCLFWEHHSGGEQEYSMHGIKGSWFLLLDVECISKESLFNIYIKQTFQHHYHHLKWFFINHPPKGANDKYIFLG